ncbi:MAG TPA: hypothetical protein VEU47_05590 [Candidatus Cybelea sp.]|nr:hypothetical protein [Candidatus Cybelea sp.]
MDGTSSMGAGFLIGLGIWAILVGIAFFALWIWFSWRVLQKMGYAGAWSLLLLLVIVPILGSLVGLAYLVAIWVLAFTQWPAERQALPPPGAARTS